jgi:omega-amidase
MLKFAAIQINNIDAETNFECEQNIEIASHLISNLPTDIDLVILPELFTSGYSENTFENLEDIAEGSTGKSFEKISKLAKKGNQFISYGYPEVLKSKYYISQNVVNNTGELVGTYRKMHLAHFGDSMEKSYFSEGKNTFSFSIKKEKEIFQLGIIICYDMRFPELIRKLAIKDNIDFLIHPVAFAQDNSFPSWHNFIITRALENQIYVMSINRAGNHFGNSIFCPPWIDFDVKPNILGESEEIFIGEIHKNKIEESRNQYSLRKDLKSNY